MSYDAGLTNAANSINQLKASIAATHRVFAITDNPSFSGLTEPALSAAIASAPARTEIAEAQTILAELQAAEDAFEDRWLVSDGVVSEWGVRYREDFMLLDRRARHSLSAAGPPPSALEFSTSRAAHDQLVERASLARVNAPPGHSGELDRYRERFDKAWRDKPPELLWPLYGDSPELKRMNRALGPIVATVSFLEWARSNPLPSPLLPTPPPTPPPTPSLPATPSPQALAQARLDSAKATLDGALETYIDDPSPGNQTALAAARDIYTNATQLVALRGR